MNYYIKSMLRKIINANYHICALSAYFEKASIKTFLPVARKICKEENIKLFIVIINMIKSNILTGCSFWEYYNLKFYKRTIKNQMTFLTGYYNSVLFHKYNSYDMQDIFYNKTKFNEVYREYRKTDWISLKDDLESIKTFFRNHNEVIFKPIRGECGHGIFTMKCKELLKNENIDEWIINHQKFECEERLYNDHCLEILNSSSLNTIRVITFFTGEECKIIWSGIRIGKPGSVVDNISEGGSCCSIDTKTGCIETEPLDEHNKQINILCDRESLIGFKIPYWNELIDLVNKVIYVIPNMRFIAWDFAITTKGVVLIEGNHGVSNTISQVHLNKNQYGHRIQMIKYMKEEKIYRRQHLKSTKINLYS